VVDERSKRALAGIDRSGLGLEIGPSYSPLVPKRSGARVEIVDHATREELVAKYESYGLPPEKIAQIEPVDHVSTGGSLVEAVGRTGVYDYVVASNVIEHTVDLIGFLQDCEQLLAPAGRLALVVPDMRYCFDLLKPATSIGAVVDAHLLPTRFHTPGSLLEHTAYACTRSGQIAWGEGEAGPIALQFDDLTVGAQHVERGLAQAEYHDTHRWKFTPASFSLLVQDLRDLGYHSFHEVAAEPLLGFEFFLTLGRLHHPPPRRDRLELLIGARDELAEVATRGGSAAGCGDRGGGGEELEAARAEIAALRASTSWRVTRPLRALSDLARRGRGD
jgi:hypothetical protein